MTTAHNNNSKLKKMGRTKRPKLERYLISPEQAIELLADCDALHLVGASPEVP
jgi:hypothetical protein